ncbi:MAG: hypothetical protein NZT92_21320, partial [Abditibacteriales bacterium]|nr:hypothetical protein [Abditibacteriales bacterium]
MKRATLMDAEGVLCMVSRLSKALGVLTAKGNAGRAAAAVRARILLVIALLGLGVWHSGSVRSQIGSQRPQGVRLRQLGSGMQLEQRQGGFAVAGMGATGQHLFAAALGPDETQLLVYNLADPSHPTALGRLTGAGDALHVTLNGNRAYLALGGTGASGQDGGLLIADVANPANPSRLGEYRFPAGYAGSVALVGTHALVGAFRFGQTLVGELHIVNVANPALPELVRLLNVEARDIAAAGTRVYLASGEAGLRILNVNNPSDPQPLGIFDTLGAVSGVAVVGNTVFLADAATAPGNPGGLRIVDVTNPAQPQPLGALSEAGFLASDVVLSGNFAYLAGFSQTLSRAQVWVLDVTNPAAPQRLHVLDSVGAPLFARNGRLFTQSGIGGFAVWDITNPALPVLLGESVPPVPLDVEPVGNLLYTAEGAQGVQVFSLANPQAPAPLGRWSRPGVFASRVAAGGDHAFVSAGGAGMRVLDVSNPRQPREVGTYPAPLGGAVTHVAVDGNQAFLSHSGGWQILDISTPASPALISDVSLGVIIASDVVRPHAFLIGSRLRVVDISNTANPRLVGQLNLPGTPRGLDAVGTLVVVAVGEAGLALVDVADPANPRLLATVDTPGNAQDVAVVGNLAFVADGFGTGVRVIDLTDLNRPAEVAFFSGIDARAVAVTNPVY